MKLLHNKLPDFLTDPNPEVYLSDNYVVFDFETTNLDKGTALNPRNRVVSVAWLCGKDLGQDGGARSNISKLHYARSNEYELEPLVEAIRRADFCIGHNVKFDLQWAGRCGLDLSNVLVYDTMSAEYVLGGNKWVWGQLSLDKVADRRFNDHKNDVVSKMIKSQVPVEDIPEEWLERYCKQDVLLTHRIFLQQRQELKDADLLPVLYSRCLLTPVLADIEKNGVQLDADRVAERVKEVQAEYGKITRELDRITGGININSREQLGTHIYETLGIDERKVKRGGKWQADRTPGGARKTDADTISALKPKNKKQRQFLELFARSKELYNELTKYLTKFGECCSDAGGRLSASFNQTATRTHRLSSTGRTYATQLHNIPRAYKSLFKARTPGWLVGECDGAQLEFRVAAHLGRDICALDDIVGGTDIHSVTASVIWPNVDWDGVEKHPKRQDAKHHTFKPLYGGQSGTEDEKRYYKFFREKYKGIASAQRTWIDTVLEQKSLTTEWGLRYYWPNTRRDRSGYVTNTTAICNYPVQAFATAEIIPLALVFFWHRLQRSGLNMFVVNTVHDSIICELPKEEIDAFHELSRKALIDDVYYALRHLYDIQFTVPLGAGVKVGEHWNGASCSDYVPAGLEHDKGEVVYTAPEDLWKV